MEEEKYIKFSIEDFVLDDRFRKWVLNQEPEDKLFWEDFQKEYPGIQEKMQKAKLIVESLQPVRPEISEIKLQNIYKKIAPPERTVYFKYWSRIAAGLVILISVGSLLWILVLQNNYYPLDDSFVTGEKGKIILSDGSVKEFDAEKTIIRQMVSGNLMVDDDTVKIKMNENSKKRKIINQVIIPYGKRSEITLSDGTHIWMNSGSSLSYPSVFNSNTREVYLSGEAFFEVSAEKTRPFYVIVKDFKIKVLGTKFNVSAYNEDPITRTVLLEGKVTASQNNLFSKEINLVPGEEVVFNKKEGIMDKQKVNVQFYTSWIKGYLLFENELTTEVFKKLERYYNQKIKYEGTTLTSSFSGKLDLSDDLSTVLENISFASSLSVSKQDSLYIIK